MEPAFYEKPKGWDAPVRDPDTLDLFAPAPPTVGTADYQTSRDAADAIAPHLKALRAEVYRVFLEAGDGLTDKELEAHPQFQGRVLGASTLRKRRGELVDMGYLIDRPGVRRDGCQVWALPPGER